VTSRPRTPALILLWGEPASFDNLWRLEEHLGDRARLERRRARVLEVEVRAVRRFITSSLIPSDTP